jgi:transcriptional regulator GlxA family with amidase domain
LHYLAYWRMQRAAALLRDTSLSIPTIVQTVGYQSEPSFNAAFKRVFGKPPGRFRQETRQTETA